MEYLWDTVRTLDIQNRQGYTEITLDNIQEGINQSIIEFEDLITHIKSFTDSYNLQEFYEDVFLYQFIKQRNIYHTTYITETVNFIEFLRSYISHSKNILGIDTAEMSILQPDMYYLFQNPLGDGIKACSYTIRKLREIEQDYVINMSYYLIYCIIAVIGAVVCSAAFIIKRLTEVQRSSNKIWSLIYSISNSKLRELQNNAIDRLSTTHKIDIERDTNFNIFGKKADSYRKKVMRVNPYKTWEAVSFYLIIAILSAGLFYGLIHTYIFGKIIELIELRPKLLTYSSNFETEIVKSYSYAKEMIYTGELSIYNITQDYVLLVEPEKLFNQSVNNYISSFNQHRRLMEDKDLKNGYITDLLFSKDSTLTPCLSLGLEYAQTTFITDLMDFSMMQLNYETRDYIKKYGEVYDEILKKYTKLSSEVLDLLNDKILHEMYMSIMGIVLYNLFIFLLYFVGVFAGTNKIKKVIDSGWNFFNDLHIGDLEDE